MNSILRKSIGDVLNLIKFIGNVFYDAFFVFRLVNLLNKRYLEKLKEEWWNSEVYKSKCEKPADQSEGISIENIGGVFIVIFIGIAMACATFVFEYCTYKFRKTTNILLVSPVNQMRPGVPSKPSDTIGHRRRMKNSTQKGRKLRQRNTNLPNNFKPKY